MSNELLTVSSKGQVVLPASLRKQLSISAGDKLASYVNGDLIILKRVSIPSLDEFSKQLEEAQAWAKSVGYTQEDVSDIIKSVRKNRQKP